MCFSFMQLFRCVDCSKKLQHKVRQIKVYSMLEDGAYPTFMHELPISSHTQANQIASQMEITSLLLGISRYYWHIKSLDGVWALGIL